LIFPVAAPDHGSGNLALCYGNTGAAIPSSSWLMPELPGLHGFSSYPEASFTASAECAAKTHTNHQPAQAWNLSA